MEASVAKLGVRDQLPPSSREGCGVDHNRQKYSPYRTLWVRVFIRAAFDYAQYKTSKDLKSRRLAEDAYRWIFDENHDKCSLQNICESFDLPLDLLRAWAKRITKNDVKKMEQLDRKGLVLKTLDRAIGSSVSGNRR